MPQTNANNSPDIQKYKIFLGKLNPNEAQWFDSARRPILESNQITFSLIPAIPEPIRAKLTGPLIPLIIKTARATWPDNALAEVAYEITDTTKAGPRPQAKVSDNSGGIDEPEENWFKFPLALINDLPKMSPAEIKVLIYIIRHTWGYHQSEREISVTEFERGRRATRKAACKCEKCQEKGLSRLDHGTGMTEKSIRNGLKKAIEHGYLKVRIDDSDRGRMKKFYSLKIR